MRPGTAEPLAEGGYCRCEGCGSGSGSEQRRRWPSTVAPSPSGCCWPWSCASTAPARSPTSGPTAAVTSSRGSRWRCWCWLSWGCSLGRCEATCATAPSKRSCAWSRPSSWPPSCCSSSTRSPTRPSSRPPPSPAAPSPASPWPPACASPGGSTVSDACAPASRPNRS